MANHEVVDKKEVEFLHLYLAISRPSKGASKRMCLRKIDRGAGHELAELEARCKGIGEPFRIHKTVNIRSVEKARKWFLTELINRPEKASYADVLWRTALLQRQCAETKNFMLDVDTTDEDVLAKILGLVGENFLYMVDSPNGYHVITKGFDTREVCEIDKVELQRDGYYYVKSVGKEIEDGS